LEINELTAMLEAILFASGDPLEPEEIARALSCEKEDVLRAAACLEDKYRRADSGLEIRRIRTQVQLVTKAAYAEAVRKALTPVVRKPLSQSALETLSIIAYRQPVTKGEIEQIRGVRCDYALEVLIRHRMVTEAGRRDSLGRPLLYATTDEFLKTFGLVSLDQLPPVENLSPMKQA